MDVEALRHGGQPLGVALHLAFGEAGLHFVVRVVPAAAEVLPVLGKRGELGPRGHLLGLVLGVVQLLLEALLELFGALLQAVVLGVDLVEARVLADRLVEHRLGDRRVVDLAVAVAPVADEVDHHVGAELVAVVDGDLGHPHDLLRVLAVDVEDRHRQPLGDVRRVAPGPERLGLGGEADQVVDHDVDGAAHGVAVQVGEVQGLGEDALAGEGGVAVHDDGQDLLRPVLAALDPDALLLGPHPPLDHRVHRFEVARVRGEMDADGAPVLGLVGAGRAHVVLDVAAAQDAPRIDVLEAGEELLGRPADHVQHDGEAPAVAHAEHRLLHLVAAAHLQALVEHGDERGHALDREALGAEVALLEDLFEDLRPHQAVQDALAPLVGRLARRDRSPCARRSRRACPGPGCGPSRRTGCLSRRGGPRPPRRPRSGSSGWSAGGRRRRSGSRWAWRWPQRR